MKDRLITLFSALFSVFVALVIIGSLLGYAYGSPNAGNGGNSATEQIMNGEGTSGLGKDIYGLVGDGHSPALSENGAQIAYYDENYQIWTVNVTGSARRQLTSGHFDLYPSWSPDGKKLAFRRSTMIEGSSHSDIWIMNSDGSHQLPLTDALGSGGNYDRPAWSPDGQRLAFVSRHGYSSPEIYIISADGANQIHLPRDDSRPGLG